MLFGLLFGEGLDVFEVGADGGWFPGEGSSGLSRRVMMPGWAA